MRRFGEPKRLMNIAISMWGSLKLMDFLQMKIYLTNNWVVEELTLLFVSCKTYNIEVLVIIPDKVGKKRKGEKLYVCFFYCSLTVLKGLRVN